ncbi:F0F1 ATP synthase subunit gamma [Thiomicrospira cyclica]|jgi:F-type H+-transporting ATPase subunit gamma|uniref:ATP synthase gamma chain n=1 Tax=Thiomicrospira cyclica (strain DSM 14477 / JCM 11371 / ALM1) TaxID=717773 RepID=F6DB32_THICA|nr:F0F1 ATP synthase subunit gamma [Thiomicrospira cyclica]AEG32365.1 ATP synthase gamma chain [Thiomicrospira cyclica ALM1]
MAGGSKEIRTQIASVKNTQKITKAMEMVAASKMRKAQARMTATRPYVEKVKRVIEHVSKAHHEYKHPYTLDRPIKRIGLMVVSSDRGLCGGLNTNLFRRTLKKIQAWQQDNVAIELAIIGKKAQTFFRHYGGNVVASKVDLGDTPHINDLVGTVKVMLDRFENGEIDAVYVASNQFESAMTQVPTIQQLIPLQAVASDDSEPAYWDYLYEPDAKEALDTLMVRYIESTVYGAVVENVACEQSARMVAMKSASDNAGKMIKELQLAYNKARQAAITQELSEIVSGASAV